ncbi:diguanylate cyclase [Oscillospiraceae bacterium CM]|nr:diguanylate cyclase [Oscillospiraceae bacterium CM]
MRELIGLILNHQEKLVKRILDSAKSAGFTAFTSTLEEPWIVSINGLSQAMAKSVTVSETLSEITVSSIQTVNPEAQFGMEEALRHRNRGIRLEMFLSMMKLYRQVYIDLVAESVGDASKRALFEKWIIRFFDLNEISFCAEWVSHPFETVLQEMQACNIDLTNEKNKYLTIFESMPTPAILLDAAHLCVNINYAAMRLFDKDPLSPDRAYYLDASDKRDVKDALPFLYEPFLEFSRENKTVKTIELDYNSARLGKRALLVKFHKMRDVSNKFTGTIILVDDMTENKKFEEQLRFLSFHDRLTGLFNRAYLEEIFERFAAGRYDPVALITIDIDGLKLVNDHCGHHAGDALLVAVGSILTNCFEDDEIVVRIGGDEFVVILPSCDSKSARAAREKLRATVESYNKETSSAPVSISVGWSVGYLRSATSYHELMITADRSMYEEKQTNHKNYERRFADYLEKTKIAEF